MIKANVTSDRVIFLDGTIDRVGAFGFVKCLDVYVSLHRSEGFGLSCAEAMACAVPVIATRYSGNLEFMNDENSLLVHTKIIETDRPYGPYPPGTRWGDPDLEQAGHAMRDMLDAGRRKVLADIGMRSVRRTLTPGATLPAEFVTRHAFA
jgi:glycosyltransferase involved in cell wall biosynthesis